MKAVTEEYGMDSLERIARSLNGGVQMACSAPKLPVILEPWEHRLQMKGLPVVFGAIQMMPRPQYDGNEALSTEFCIIWNPEGGMQSVGSHALPRWNTERGRRSPLDSTSLEGILTLQSHWAWRLGGHITPLRSALYWIAQLLGSTLACFLLKFLTGVMRTPLHRLAAGMGYFEGVAMEIVLTFSLLFMVYATVVNPKKGSVRIMAPLCVGLVLGANIMARGPFSGASMNAARLGLRW